MSSVPNSTAAVYARDIFSTFHYSSNTHGIADLNIAIVHQRFLMNFIKNADPNVGIKVPRFQGYDVERGNWMLDYRLDGDGKAEFVRIEDPGVNGRREWLEEVLYPHYTA